MHLKRKNIEKFWPIPRKGTKYVATPSHNQKEALPLVVVMRDMLKIARNSRELKRLLYEKQILVNHKIIRETNYPISLFDIISIPNAKKNYRAILSESKKMAIEEISEKDSHTKIFKVINKKILPEKKLQLNLMHGKNIISREKANTGDSILFDLKENKIAKIIPMGKDRKVFVLEGKHAGQSGKISEIVERGGKSIAKIASAKGKINVWIENTIVIE